MNQPQPATSLKKILSDRCFPVNFAKFLRTAFLTEHLQWLLSEYSSSLDLQPVVFMLNFDEAK